MSYCRMSTDSFRCDLYCYGDVSGGITTHVATHRHVRTPESPEEANHDLIDEGRFAEWTEQHRAFSAWLDTAETKPIGGPFDGETFNDPDLASFRERLIKLRAAGYCFPDYVLADVDEELSTDATDAQRPIQERS